MSVGAGRTSSSQYGWSIVVTTPHGDCSHTFALPGEPTDPVWSPDGRHLAFSLGAGDGWFRDVYVLDVRTGAVTPATNTRRADEVVGDWG
jgi:Tol biopolymer transport system component